MKTTTKWLGAAALAFGTILPVGAATAAGAVSAPYCGLTWGSLPKQDTGATNSAELTNVRAGQHDCYDRLVLDGASWARVRYVDKVTTDGAGEVVPLRGGARLEIITTRADDPNTGQLTYRPANPTELVNVTGYRTFRQAAFAGSFEGQTTLGLGVRARLPFRVFELDTPGHQPRIVIDVAHRW